MNFKSIEFLIFFPIVAFVLFQLPGGRRWMWLLLASIFFYSRWRLEYLVVIKGHATIDFFVAQAMASAPTRLRRKLWLALSLATGLGLLFYFKYLGFFAQIAEGVLQAGGVQAHFSIPHILIPLGISFYTFQSLAYVIDVYRGNIQPERHLGYFLLFVSYFPQLVAGPIERPAHLLTELRKERPFDFARLWSGLSLMLWGFFKKLVIADHLAFFVNPIYANVGKYDGAMLALASFFFAFQIYCDFSGYSDIAIGCARIMGHDLTRNFNRPYEATSMGDFWHRWHISLSSWFRDYVFIPLGGSRVGWMHRIVNLMVVFLLSGLWHGANWTFVAWGAAHGLIISLEAMLGPSGLRVPERLGLLRLPKVWRAFRWLTTFILACLTWVLFRANSIEDAAQVFTKIFKIGAPELAGLSHVLPYSVSPLVMMCLMLWVEHQYQGKLPTLLAKPIWIRWPAYAGVLAVIFALGRFGSQDFIYFQF